MTRSITSDVESLPAPARFAALKASAFLSFLFLSVYGGTNWVAAHRFHIPTLFFSLERQIPFVPWMIGPYMSIDLFFVVAPFLCRTQQQLELLIRRMVFAVLVAGICFLLFPLRFAFERPPVSGWLGSVFNIFRTIDQPYNLLPSLHIAILTILAQIYFPRRRPLARAALALWFGLIAVSTVLTYQHHVLDVFGGLVLGAFALCLFPDLAGGEKVLTSPRNNRVGFYYAAGAVFAFAVAIWFWPWTSPLLWPAVSLSFVAAGYFRLGTAVFRKTDGRLPLITRVLLAPSLFGQRLSWLYYRKQCRPYDEIVPGLFLGRQLTTAEARAVVESGITAVLDLSAEFSEARSFLNVEYLNIPVLDLTVSAESQLVQMSRFIAKHLETGKVYVHCKVGYSRSAAAVAAYLLSSGKADNVSSALAILRHARPTIIVRPEVIEALNVFVRRQSQPGRPAPAGSLVYV